jgi:hypothetical protein
VKAITARKQCEELRAEMSPFIPEKIRRRRRQARYRRAFQSWMELVNNDE